MRVTLEQYKKFMNNSINQKQSKYHNKKVVIDGHKFDSKKEANYYLKYKTMQDMGLIKDLELQVSYELIPTVKLNGKTYRKTTYKADFRYFSNEDNRIHIIDVKGVKTDVYMLKKKLMAYKGFEIEEV